MSFLRHKEIYQSEEDAIIGDRALAHRLDEFPAGYSLAGCAPAEPASASPTVHHFAVSALHRTIENRRTANSVLTVCLTPGGKPRNAPLCEELADAHVYRNRRIGGLMCQRVQQANDRLDYTL